MITIKFLSACPEIKINYEIVKNMTMIDFMLEIGKNRPELIIDNDFLLSILKDGVSLTQFDNRYDIVMNKINENDILYAKWCDMLHPDHRYKYKNNLSFSEVKMRNKICPICDLSNKFKFQCDETYSCILDCDHCFHYKCLPFTDLSSCKICRFPINLNKLKEISSILPTSQTNIFSMPNLYQN
jgi:hypothetical protein